MKPDEYGRWDDDFKDLASKNLPTSPECPYKWRGWPRLEKTDKTWDHVKHRRVQDRLFTPDDQNTYTGMRVTIANEVDENEIDDTTQQDLQKELEHSQIPLTSATIPVQPTAEEVQKHNETHLPFAQWCPACVQGCGADDPHPQAASDHQDNKLKPTVQMDFMFLRSEKDIKKEDLLTYLCLYRLGIGAGSATVVMSKGPQDVWRQKAVEDFLTKEGIIGGCNLRADPEKGAWKIAKLVAKENAGVGTDETPKKSSKSNGGVERFHRTVQGLLRTYKVDLMHRYKLDKMDVGHKLVPWLMRHAGWVHTHFQKHLGEFTAYRRRTGKEYEGKLCEPGETVQWK